MCLPVTKPGYRLHDKHLSSTAPWRLLAHTWPPLVPGDEAGPALCSLGAPEGAWRGGKTWQNQRSLHLWPLPGRGVVVAVRNALARLPALPALEPNQ